MTQKQKTKKEHLSLAMGIGLLLIAVLLTFNGYTLAKYVFGQEEDAVFVAKEFYFESDLLKSTEENMPQYTLQTGVNDISFVLKNYPDALRVSEVDIDYSVVLKKNGEKVEERTDTIKVNDKSNLISFTELAPGTYMVTATATKPYTKTLYAEFVITAVDNVIRWKVNDNAQSPYLQLIVQTADSDGTIKISWQDGIVPDNTDPLLVDATSNDDDEKYEVNMKANSEYAFVFFKEQPSKNYGTDAFQAVGLNNEIDIVEKTEQTTNS